MASAGALAAGKTGPVPHLVLVVVALMAGVAVPVMDEVHVIAVVHSFMSAAFSVHVGVVLMGEVRQVMLVVMALVRSMRVPLMDVVDVILMRNTGVPALRSVGMVVLGMGIVPRRFLR